MTTKFAFNPFTGNFDLVTATVSPSDITGGTPLTLAGFDATGTLFSPPGLGFVNTATDIVGESVAPPVATSVTSMQGVTTNFLVDGNTATGLSSFNIVGHVGDTTATSLGSLNAYVNTVLVNANAAITNVTAFVDNMTIAAGASVPDVNSFEAAVTINQAAQNSYNAFLSASTFGASSATNLGYIGVLNAFDTYGANLITNNATAINLSLNIEPGASISSLTSINLNPQIDGVTSINGYRGIEIGGNFGNSTPTTVNNHIDYQAHPTYKSGSSLDSYTGVSLSPSFEVGSTLNGAQAINYNMAISGTVTGNIGGINANNNIGSGGSPTVVNFYQDANFNPNFGADATLGYYHGVTVRANVQAGASITNDVTLMDLAINSVVPVGGNATGLFVDMSNFQTPAMPQALNIQGGGSQLSANFDTGLYPVHSTGGPIGLNNIGGQFHIAAGFPITGGNFGIGNNFGIGILADDDMPVDSTGINLGFVMTGFLTQIGVAATKSMASLTFMGAGASNALGSTGTIDEVNMFRAIGILPGSGIVINNMYGFKVDPLLTAASPANAWGVWVGDTNADNWFAKDVIIGGVTGKPSNSDVALEIADLKAIKLPQLTTTQKLALAPLESMQVYDSTLGAISWYNGTSWVEPVSGVIPVTQGGTGLTTLTADSVILGNGTSSPTFVAPGTTGNILTSNGTTWVSAPNAGSAGVTAVYNFNAPQAVGASGVIVYTDTLVDATGSYNTSTGVFTAPVAGVYSFSIVAYQATTSASLFFDYNFGANQGYICTCVPGVITSGSFMFPMTLGGTMTIRTDTAVTFAPGPLTNGPANSINIAKVGD